jgi:hypothetical protein
LATPAGTVPTINSGGKPLRRRTHFTGPSTRRRSSSSMALKRAMRSWMSIAAATAARDELNSASRESPVLSISLPPAMAMAGRQSSVCTDLRCLTVSSSSPSIMRTKPVTSA